MTRHVVKLHVEHHIDVGYTDFSFEVFEDENKLGTLKVSKGTVDWFPRSSKKLHYAIEWAALSKLIMENGAEKDRPVRRRR